MGKNNYETVEMLAELTKPKKQKVKRERRGRRQDLKKFTKSKYIKKAKKDEYINDLIANFDGIEKEMRRLYSNGKSKLFDEREDLVELLTNKKFAKYVCKAVKEMNEDKGSEVPYVLLFAVGDMFVNNDEAFVNDEDISKRYMKLFSMFYNDKIKKLSKKMGVTKTDALAFYLTSLTFKDVKAKLIYKRTSTFLNLLYNMDDLDAKKVKLALKTCYGKRLGFVISSILGEKPRQGENFSIVTNAVLEIMEKMDKEELKELLKRYAKRRKQNPKSPRRVDLTKIDDVDYKNIHKIIDKLNKTGYNKELFM